jgi:hypothetical protein
MRAVDCNVWLILVVLYIDSVQLPNYRSKELMRVKLIAAIEAGAGFELT